VKIFGFVNFHLYLIKSGKTWNEIKVTFSAISLEF